MNCMIKGWVWEDFRVSSGLIIENSLKRNSSRGCLLLVTGGNECLDSVERI